MLLGDEVKMTGVDGVAGNYLGGNDAYCQPFSPNYLPFHFYIIFLFYTAISYIAQLF